MAEQARIMEARVHSHAIGRAPRRRGNLIDGLGPEERKRILRILGHEHDGRHKIAAVEFSDAALMFVRRDKLRASELYERAGNNDIKANRPVWDVRSHFNRAIRLNPASRDRIVAALVRWANEPGREHLKAGDILKYAAGLIRPANSERALRLLAGAGEHFTHTWLKDRAGNIFAKAAGRARDPAKASELRERAGDAYHAGDRHGDALAQYRLAAKLVRKTDPERARMLEEKAKKEREYSMNPSETVYQGYLGH